MSSFSGINQFGTLTTQNGVKLTFKDFDKDGDGQITKEEYTQVLKEMDLDKVELSTLDKNKDNVLSNDEFAVWEQKVAMQEAVNAMAGTISNDFANDISGMETITKALKNYIEEFASNSKYTGKNVSKMSEAFAKELPNKYEKLKSEIFENSQNSVKSKVLEEFYTEIINSNQNIPEAAAKAISKELDAEATRYAKSNPNFTAEDLKSHLKTYMTETDAEKLKNAATTLKSNMSGFGNIIDSSELKELKEYATEFLTAAVEAGVTVKLGNNNIKTTAAIKTTLSKYTDGQELKTALEEAISGLSKNTRMQNILNANMTTDDLTGNNYKIDNSKIDFNVIDGYTDVNGNGTIHERGKGYSGSVDKAKDKARELINQDALKNQYIQQITTMLESKGMKFDDIKTDFENIWSQSLEDALNSDGIITGRGARGFSKKGHAYINIKDMVNKFDEIFQTNIKTTMDAKVQANKTGEMYLGDLDLSAINMEDDSGTVTNARELYFSGETVKTRKRGGDYYTKIAEQMVDKLKDQMMTKAKAMCAKKGVTFDEASFNKMFSSAKKLAVSSAVYGMDSDGTKYGAAAALSVEGAGAGIMAAANAVAVAKATGAAGSFGGPVGIVVGAAVGLIAGLIIGKGHHSESYLNTQTLINNFTNQFKTDFTNWVENEATKKKNEEEKV